MGDTTTGYIWAQQTSPNATNDNGLYSVAVNVEVSADDIVQCLVPVTFVSPWDAAIPSVVTGTAVSGGSISQIATDLGVSTAKDVGIGDPVLVASFMIKAVAAGTVTLTPTNWDDPSAGWTGVTAFGGSADGDEANYVSVDITVN